MLVEPDHPGKLQIPHIVGVVDDSHRVGLEERDPVAQGRRFGGGGCCGREFPAGHTPIVSEQAFRGDAEIATSPKLTAAGASTRLGVPHGAPASRTTRT